MDNVSLKIERFTHNIIYYVLWIIEVVLLLRLVLRLLGANPYNQLVDFVYSLSTIFMGPFRDVFGVSAINGMIFEPSILIAMVFYAIAAYILIFLVNVFSGSSGSY